MSAKEHNSPTPHRQWDQLTYAVIVALFAAAFLLCSLPPSFSGDVLLQRSSAAAATPWVCTAAPSAAPLAADASPAPPATEAPAITYILNTNSMRFHLPDCNSVATIKEDNCGSFTGAREELLDMGYVPCGACKP